MGSLPCCFGREDEKRLDEARPLLTAEGTGLRLGDLPLPKVLQFLSPSACLCVSQLSSPIQQDVVVCGKVIVPWLVCTKASACKPEELLARISLENVVAAWFRGIPSALSALKDALQSGDQNMYQLQRFTAVGCNFDGDSLPLLSRVMASGQVSMINFELNQLSDDTVTTLVELLLTDRTLETLCIRSNKLTDRGAEALARLEHHPALKVLNLKQNSIGSAGAAALAKLVRSSRTLENLNLRAQTPKLPSSAGIILAKALSVNSTLRRLKLRRNRMDDAVASALVEPLTSGAARSSLLELDLQENALTAAGGTVLMQILFGNTALEVVFAGGNRFSMADVQKHLQGPMDVRMQFEVMPDV